MKCFLLAATAAIAMGVSAQASAAPAAPFKPDRTAEDYAFLKDPAKRGDWSDVYKFIPFDDRGDIFLSLGGELRERFESIDAPRSGIGVGQSDYLLQRVLVHGDLHVGANVRLFAQLGAHDAVDKFPLNLPDENRLDVQQLFVEAKVADGATIRVGRQELAFNPLQRFVSFRDSVNVRQNFDGGRVTVARGPLRLDAFLLRPVLFEPGTFDDSRNRDARFGGLYASRKLGEGQAMTLDAYWFASHRENLPGSIDERRQSVGLRFAGERARFDWDGEAVYQFGEAGSRDIAAWAGAVDLGMTLSRRGMKPRVGLRFDVGSGDDDPGDEQSNGFFPLFGSGTYFNEAGLTSWTNLVAVRPSVRLQPTPKLAVTGAVQAKWRQDRDDAVYLGNGPIGETRANRARAIGQTYSVDANWQLNRNLALRGYYLRHSAGAAIERARGKPVDFLMTSATLRF